MKKVKKYKNGFITDPLCLKPKDTVAQVHEIKETHGFSGIPITDTGTVGGKLLGMVSSRDVDFVEDQSQALDTIMTKELVTATEGCTLTEANKIMQESKMGKLPIVNGNNELVSLISRLDLIKNRDYPNASKDSNKGLLVAGAIGTRLGDRDRAVALIEAGVDVLVIDSSQGDSMYQVNLLGV